MYGLLILLPLAAALAGFFAGRHHEQRFYRIMLAACAAEFLLAIGLAFLPAGEFRLPLVCDFGLYLSFDGFRKVYTLIISFMWMMTSALSRDYFAGHHQLARYFFFVLLTLSSTMGVFLAGDLYTAFIFFEVMSFASFPWVIQEETDDAIRAANTYLAVAVIGGLTALMGIFLLYNRLGTTELSGLYAAAAACSDRKVLYIAGSCILFGFGAKAGMFPLHIWLPKAHPVAPAPSSALLSGVLTKSGIFGIVAISSTIFRYDPAWGTALLTLGTVTMFLGALLALFSVNLKRTLACSSMSQIGFILIGVAMMCRLGDENALAARGALLHMVNHSLFKLVLFMCAGVVYMNLHELDLNRIRGFGRKKPLLNACFLLAAAGIGGIPGLNGYVSKTLLHESIVEGTAAAGWPLKVVEWIFLISGGLTLAYMTKLYVCLFLSEPAKEAAAAHSHFGKEKKDYMSGLSRFALIGSAAVLPVLGLTAPLTMDRIADIGTDFSRSAELEHTVHYFSLENLKGAGISVLIGAFFYFVIVRKCLMKDGVYLNRWPKKLDLEDLVYRPLLLKVLPAVLGAPAALFGENRVTRPVFKGAMAAGAGTAVLFGENRVTAVLAKGLMRVSGILSRFFSDILDAVILLLRKTVYRPASVDARSKTEQSLAYRLGEDIDKLEIRVHKEKPGGRRFAHRFYRLQKTFLHATHDLTDSLSFALLMLCLAICAIFIYILLIHP